MGFPIWKFNIPEKSQDWELEGIHCIIQFLSKTLVNYLKTFFLIKKMVKMRSL